MAWSLQAETEASFDSTIICLYKRLRPRGSKDAKTYSWTWQRLKVASDCQGQLVCQSLSQPIGESIGQARGGHSQPDATLQLQCVQHVAIGVGTACESACNVLPSCQSQGCIRFASKNKQFLGSAQMLEALPVYIMEGHCLMRSEETVCGENMVASLLADSGAVT